MADPDAASLTAEPPTRLSFRRPDLRSGGGAKKLNAAERGTATHRFLQYVDFAKAGSAAGLAAEADRLAAAGRLTSEERAALDLPGVERLFASPLGRRMRAAEKLRREFRFLLLCKASEYVQGAAPEDEILLQGVVDCCFAEDGGITVVDYKTDRIDAAEAPARAERYRGQLLAYAGALERIFDLPVRRCVLWFLHPGAEYEIALENQAKTP